MWREVFAMKVLIVDDQYAVRAGVRSTVESCEGFEVVGEAANGEEAIQQAARLNPDLMIMDISMPVLDGLTAAEIVKKYYQQIRILILSGHAVREFIESAKRLGLDGYVPKEDTKALLDALDAVRHNYTYFPELEKSASAWNYNARQAFAFFRRLAHRAFITSEGFCATTALTCPNVRIRPTGQLIESWIRAEAAEGCIGTLFVYLFNGS
jgi:DNA-binding NarL/FixJ family response regulator